MSAANNLFDLDAAFRKPSDPLEKPASPEVIYRDLPAAFAFGWDPDMVTGALAAHVQGNFSGSALLTDALMGDPRVQATTLARTQALFGRTPRFKKGTGPKADACLAAWEALWPRIGVLSTLSEVMRFAIMMGFSHCEVLWDTSEEVWCPILKPWLAQHTGYDMVSRQYYAQTYDGQRAITPGDCKWYASTPHGSYRAWLHGAVRAVAVPWLTRQFAIRDFSRFCEIHGIPIVLAKVPAVGDAIQKQRFQASLRNLGSESVVMLPQGVDQITASYNMELLEATDTSWQAFPGMLAACDSAIILAILGENLTTEISGDTGGSFGAAKVHGDVAKSVLFGDNTAFRSDMYTCVARPFALMNFGDAEAAPITDFDCDSIIDVGKLSQAAQAFALACDSLSKSGVEYDPAALAEAMRVPGVKSQPSPKPPVAPATTGGGFGAKSPPPDEKPADEKPNP